MRKATKNDAKMARLPVLHSPTRRVLCPGRGWSGIVVGTIALLFITGVAAGCAEDTGTGITTPAATATSAAFSPLGSAAAIVASTKPTATKTQPTRTATATAAAPTQPASAPAAVPKPAPPAPARTTRAAAPPPSTNASCYPLSNGGNCYEPGEFCRTADHGKSGVAGDGKPITCENNYGWRWEPT
jgi:hypothetical protein